MISLRVFFKICLLLSFTTLWAQSVTKITGMVRDRVTGKPLYGADIVVEGTGFGASTDERGQYVIENLFAGEYTLIASYMGYKSQTKPQVKVSLDQPVRVDFDLTPMVIQLPAIRVTAPHIPEEPTASVTVITAREIRKTDARDLGELLRQVPGVEVLDRNGQRTISIRGSRANQVLVLVDGVRLNDAMIGAVDLSTIPLDMVERIEVIKGGGSARFGPGAIGGVINILTKKSWETEVVVEGKIGAFGSLGCFPIISGNWKNLGYFLSFEHLHSDGDYPYSYQHPNGILTREKRINADFSSSSLFVKCNYRRGRHKIELHSHRFRSQRGLPGLIFSLTPYARARTHRDILRGHYQGQWDQIHIDFNVGYHRSITEYKNIYPPDAPLRYRTVPKYHSRNLLTDYQMRLTAQTLSGGRHTLQLGYEGDWVHYSDENLLQPGIKPIGEARDHSHGIYLHSELVFPFGFQRLLLTSGLRYDWIRLHHHQTIRYERRWSPRLGLLLSRGRRNRISLRANWGWSFRPPTFADLFYQEYRIAGKPDLRPEKSLSYEFGLEMDWHLGGELQLEVIHFYNRMKDLIVWRLGSFATFSPFNTDAEISGEEYHLSWHSPNDVLVLNWNRTDLEPINKSGERTTHDKDLPYRPRTSTKIGMEINYRGFQLQYQRRKVGGRFVTEANTVKMPGYAVDDLTVGVKVRVRGIDVQLRGAIYNLRDVRYEMVERAPAPPREWRLGVRLKMQTKQP